MLSAAKIIFIYYKVQFVEFTLSFALKNVADKLGMTYQTIELSPSEFGFNKISSTDENVLVFFIFDTNRGAKELDLLKIRVPNAKLIQFGGDVHYAGIDKELFARINLHIDPMTDIVRDVNSLGFRAAHYYWTISETLIKMIQDDDRPISKNHDIICLCTENTPYRTNLFNDLRAHFSTYTHLQERDFTKIIGYYKRSYISLGTSSPCIGDWTKRSNKGFRDWISPFTQTLLIYDDIAEIKEINKNELIVPIFPYDGERKFLIDLIKYYKENTEKRQELIEKQRTWVNGNTIESQLLNIINKHF